MLRQLLKQTISLFLIIFTSSIATGAILTTVPMQGNFPAQGNPMVHVSILFRNQSVNTFGVSIDPIIPQLTPLTISNPDDSFDSADPWAQPLEGKAFSRRYGFVLDGESDNLPLNTTLRIRQIQTSDNLNVYYLRSTTPKEFTGIFGTQGSDTTWSWNLAMFHPTYVVPGEIGTYQAKYEIFLANVLTNLPQDGYTPMSFTLNLTAVPEPTTLLFLVLSLILYRNFVRS
jgi:hypothetical protein